MCYCISATKHLLLLFNSRNRWKYRMFTTATQTTTMNTRRIRIDKNGKLSNSCCSKLYQTHVENESAEQIHSQYFSFIFCRGCKPGQLLLAKVLSRQLLTVLTFMLIAISWCFESWEASRLRFLGCFRDF